MREAGGAGEEGSYRSYTHTVYEIARREGGHAGHLTRIN